MRVKIKLWGDDGTMVLDTDSGKRGIISHYIRSIPFKKGYIRVVYTKPHYNDATFTSMEDAKYYLRTFTEADLVRTLTI